MYIILRGSVNVRVAQKNENYVEHKIVTVLYDGFHFGELAMMKTQSKQDDQKHFLQNLNVESLDFIRKQLKIHENVIQFEEDLRRKGFRQEERDQFVKDYKEQQKSQFKSQDEQDLQNQMGGSSKEQQMERTQRAASIECCEKTQMLAINKDDFNTILMGLMQETLDIKIKLLSFQPFALIPIANLLKVEKYGINDVIVFQGRKVEKFYILSKGCARIVRSSEVTKDQKLSDFAVRLKNHPINFKFNMQNYRENKTRKHNFYDMQIEPSNYNQDPHQDITNVKSLPIELVHPLRRADLEKTITLFEYTKQQYMDKTRVKYIKFEDYGKFTIGDTFGQRALTGYNLTQTMDNSAQLHVIADTNDVEVYSLKKDQLIYLPEQFKAYFMQELSFKREFDDYDFSQETEKIQCWEDLKQEQYIYQLFQQTAERNRPNYKEF